MVIVTDSLHPTSLNRVYDEKFQTNPKKTPRNEAFLESVYSYPPKYKVKWDSIDELNEDLFMDYNYGVLEHSLPFLDFVQDWFFRNKPKEIQSQDYSFKNLKDGYLNKLYSSDFYNNKTKEIQNQLESIPVFVILNGYNEIVLNKSINVLTKQTPLSHFKQKVYELCGAFDNYAETKQKFGFFFFDQVDAEIHLEEIAKNDSSGTNILGLSLHCVGLDTAYKIMREYHPGIDLRFVPNLSELKNFLLNDLTSPNYIFEDEQQQLRFRRRNVNIFSFLGKAGLIVSPSSSLLQRNEYFKGVPIFVVQISDHPVNYYLNQYFKIINPLDTIYGNFIQGFDYLLGFGHNKLMQGSLKDVTNSKRVKNYVFFNKQQVETFIKTRKDSIVRFKGSRVSNAEFFVRKPKVYVYNLEDFIELWEEKLLKQPRQYNSLIDCGETVFVTPQTLFENVKELNSSNQKTTFVKNIKQNLNLKYRKFKSFLGIFFGVSYFT